MSVPLFVLQLKYSTIPGLVTLGKYDGSHSCLTAATTGGKVLIHYPHKKENEISILNINQEITALCAGKLNPNDEKDILAVGTPNSILAYHIDNNSDLFYAEVPDGVNSIVIGKLGTRSEPLLFIGGNCSIQGFDWKGNEVFWTVTADNIRSMILMDIDADGQNELIVGSDDYEIRIFKDDVLIYEITETEMITCLVEISTQKFGYALANGTVGVYENTNRLWRVKSKNAAQCLMNYDLNADGSEELVTGWANGKLDARQVSTGEVIFRDVLPSSVVGLVMGDYRKVGKNQLIVVSEDGEVRGYDSSCIQVDLGLQIDTVRELFLKKQNLLMELRNYNTVTDNTGIPANTRLMTEITSSPPSSNEEKGYVLLKLSTNNLTVLRLATIFAEGIFGGETLVVCPPVNKVQNRLHVQLVPPKETPLDAFVGISAESEQFHVFEVTKQLPQFSMFIITSCTPPEDLVRVNFVSFTLNERAQRIEMWLCQKFIIPPMMSGRTIEKKNKWFVALKSLRDSSTLLLSYEENTMHIETSNLQLAADIVISITEYLNIDQLQTYVEIPSIFEQIESRMGSMQELEQNSSKITSYVANNARTIRTLIVQVEDSRLLGNMKEMRDFYIQLKQQNEEVIQNYKVRCSEHDQYLDNLRHLNNIIQQAARLRVGPYKTELIQKCRTALTSLNAKSLIKIIQTGTD
ncbi:hypothetical protein M8J75_010430 [Diaphorina citri]|nr:hypothetical protein M8J75_010430 [Diaphorina citri]